MRVTDVALARARLLLDICSMKIFVWMLGRNGELLDSHLFFFDRYSDLADYYRRKGLIAKADRLAALAEMYFQAAPDDDEPPEAAVMAMPVPATRINTNALSTIRMKHHGRRRSSKIGAIADPARLSQLDLAGSESPSRRSSACRVPAARTFSDLHDLRHERDSGVLAVTNLRVDFPAARRWKDQVTRLKTDVAIAIGRVQP
jgi:hypothetical protein